ncbi:hypothetical protein GCM10029964_043430 [Kibdelosporangium lantanae]
MAHLDLVADIQATGQLWVKGEARRGNRVVVGVAGYPIAAPVRFVRRRDVHRGQPATMARTSSSE